MDRWIAAGVACLAVAALAGQFAQMPEGAPEAVWARLWLMAGFFTILTNGLIAVTMTARALGARIGAAWALTLVVAIVMVSAVYHAVLAALWSPQGLAWWSDQGLHSAVPLAYGAWWLAFAGKRLRWSALAACLAWPLGYCAYALVRGGLTGFWPYPFLDGSLLTPAELARNIAGLSLAFAILAAGLIAACRRFIR